MRYLLSIIVALLTSLLAAGIFIPLVKKKDVRQTVLSYVEEHKSKNGTPTMGGIIFIVGTTLTFSALWQGERLPLFILVIALSGGFIGFLDDVIKVKFKRNLGLKAYQKIIFQLAVAAVLSYFAYEKFGGAMFVPFLNRYENFGYFSVAINFIAYLALINTVNLTDGLDGLCVSVSGLNVFFFALVAAILYEYFGLRLSFDELSGTVVLSLAAVGGMLGYFIVNCFPAYVFMGDVGSMFLGSLLAGLAVMTSTTLFVPIIGIVYVITGLSDIIQVTYFKLTKGKRVFLMAPLHHHLQQKGLHENRIVAIYSLCTMLFVSIILFSLFGGNNGIFGL